MKSTSKTLNILLWIAQIFVSLTLIWAAYTKLFTPADQLAAMWPWTANNATLVKATAIIDLLGALGLVLPWLLKIKPVLTVYAAYGTILLMIIASAFHISRGEADKIGINIAFAALAAFIAWGRRKSL